jgi:hypothetical protein
MLRQLTALLSLVAALSAQINVDTLGSTASAPTGPTLGKGSLFAVTTTVTLLEYEMYLDVPGPDTLTFFAYRHHSRTGTSTLEWTLPVAVTGGTGPGWYSTGPIALPLVAGNYYVLGVSWVNTLTYYFTTAQPGYPVSFGNWQRAHTLNLPLPTTLLLTGSDIAQYYQRLTTVPTGAVVNTGTGCSATTLVPRLVANDYFVRGATTTLELVDALPNAIGLFGLANGAASPVPVPLFGCSIWLDLSGPVVTLATVISGAGYANLPFPVPNDPLLIGLAFSGQALVFGPTNVGVSNAVTFVVE